MSNENIKKNDQIENIRKIPSFEATKINSMVNIIKEKKVQIQAALDAITAKRDKFAQQEVDEQVAKVIEVDKKTAVEKVATAPVEIETVVIATEVALKETTVIAEAPIVVVAELAKPTVRKFIPPQSSIQNPSVYLAPSDGSTQRRYNPNAATPISAPRTPSSNNFNNSRPPYNPNNSAQPTGGYVSRPPYNPNNGGQRPPYNPNNNYARPGEGSSFRPQTGGVSRPTPTMSLPKDLKKKPAPDKVVKPVFDDKRNMNRKTLTKKGFLQDNTNAVEYDESGEIRRIRTRKVSNDKRKSFTPTLMVIEHAILNKSIITIKELSEKIGKTGAEIIKKLFLLGIIKVINDTIDFDTAELVSTELGVTLELQLTKTSEEILIESHVEDAAEDISLLKPRPPIVTIMGHVDHGKTSILDYIRKANVVRGEAGGITQHIGAYTISINNQPITFLDTPGHEAFTSMRARGANLTDIAIIVVAADDGIMPQTIEAINHAKAANVSIIIAVNKMDKPTAQPEKILQQMTEHGVLAEDWGGDVPVCKVSAKTGAGIEDLLKTILITAEIMELKANPERSAKGTIIEARLDKGKGPVATVLVQAGTLKTTDYIVVGTTYGRIRGMIDDKGRPLAKAGPSIPVAVLGLQDVPNAGDQIMVVEDEKLCKQVVEERRNKEKVEMVQSNVVTIDDVFNRIAEGKFKDLNIIIKADVQGSSEAIKQSLLKLSNEEVRVIVVHSGVGAIKESDIMLADTTSSLIVAFNVRPDTNAKAMAEKYNINIKTYSIIYEAIDDITRAIKGMTAPKYKEQINGKAEVRMCIKVSGAGTIAGCMVKDGKILRNSKVRLLRDGVMIFDGNIGSLKRFKDDVKEVATGFECGINIEGYNDVKELDILESYSMVAE